MSDTTNLRQDISPLPAKVASKAHHLPEVITVRNWKEYLGESLLIIFSVGLALILTEWINKVNEKKQINELIHNVREELIHNKSEVQKQYAYHLTIVNSIDSAVSNPDFASQVINKNEVYLDKIAPHGILYGDLEDVAWQLVKAHNMGTSLDIPTITLLTSIYNDQQRIIKVEEEVGNLLLSADSRKPENLRLTLILIRDNFRGWATNRVPDLLIKYRKAIDELTK